MSVKMYSKGSTLWPAQAERLQMPKIVEMYNNGFAGAFQEPSVREAFMARLPVQFGSDVAHANNFADSGKGKLSIPFLLAHKYWPNMWPKPAQETGSCVGHAGGNSATILIAVEATLATPDPVTGKIEGWPEISDKGIRNGVVATEPIYGYRGHGGQGASCGRLQDYVTTKGGVIIRKKYDSIDLEEYDDMLGASWGSRGTPESVNAIGREHQIRTATECENHEICRDFVANGYPIWCCSGLGWSSSRDENGYSKKSGGWSHSWVVGGYDDRDVIKQKYGFPLFLFIHDWGKWNSGGKRILGTSIDIADGMFWGDARLLDQCECTAMSSLNGWPSRKLPDWGGSVAG